MQATELSKTRRIELILRQVETLPTLPAVAAKLLQLTASDASNTQEVIATVKADPPLTAKLLKLCRASDRGVRMDTLSIDKAVLLLGFNAVRNAVLSLKVIEAFERATPEGITHDPEATHASCRFDAHQFWLHCLAVATCCERIATACRLPDVSADDAFVCGLLHDIGKLALHCVLPQAYSRVLELAEVHQGNIADHERRVLGIDHHTAGKRLAEQWKLPHKLQDAIWLHGSAFETLPKLEHRRLIGIVTLADLMCRRRHLGYSGNFSPAGDVGAIAQKLGLDPALLEQATDDLPQRVAKLSASLGMDHDITPQSFVESLKRANEALGKANENLERKARAAQAQAQVLDTINHFNAQISPGRSVQDVLDAVAMSSRQLLGPGFFAILHPTRVNLEEAQQASKGPDEQLVSDDTDPASVTSGVQEAWLLCHYDEEGNPMHRQYVDVPPHAPDLARFDAEQSLNMTLMSVLPWVADHLVQADDLRKVQIMPMPSGWGTSGLLLHDRPVEMNWKTVVSIATTWGVAIAAANQHEGAKRLGEQLADANTQLAAAQDGLTRAQTMARLGEMAAGAAHEMNNPLANIAGRAQLLTMRLDKNSKEHQSAQTIFREAHRLSDLITSLRMFADPPRAHRQATVLSTVLGNAVQKIAQASKRRRDDLEFSVKLPAVMPELWLDPEHVERAVIELLTNAVQANPKRNITVSARLVSDGLTADPALSGVKHGEDKQSPLRQGSVLISVTDDGEGMDAHTLEHATDPFFSAKTAGRQVGMGLSRVQQLAGSHGGTIDLRSTPGRGTTATLVLPLH